MAKSSLKIGETPDIDQGINPDEQQIYKSTLEETPVKISVSTTNSVDVLSLLTPSQTPMPPLVENPIISKSNFIHPTYDKLIYRQLGNEIHRMQIKTMLQDIFG